MFENLHRIQRNRELNGELNGERGFTLIELLIVIVVLGILAAIVVFALGGVTGTSAVSACTSDAKTVSIAVSAYDAQVSPSASTAITQANLLNGYLKSWPSNPSYYAIGLGGTGAGTYVTVTPGPGTPGVAAGSQAFEAGSSTTGAGVVTNVGSYQYTTPASLVNKGICAGV